MTQQEIQAKSKELKHCACSRLFECPCRYFTDTGICHCAGDQHPGLTMEEWIEYNTKK
jgi:hypothetical protein